MAPGGYEALVAQGEAALGKRQLDQARSAFERALKMRPQSGAAERGLGRCFVQEGKPADAKDHFQRAARSGLKEAWFDLAEVQRVLAANDEAAESYRKYLASGGGSRTARARKALEQLSP